jgi:hypothetical protein
MGVAGSHQSKTMLSSQFRDRSSRPKMALTGAMIRHSKYQGGRTRFPSKRDRLRTALLSI